MIDQLAPLDCFGCKKPIPVGGAVYFWGSRGFCDVCNAEKVQVADREVAAQIRDRRRR